MIIAQTPVVNSAVAANDVQLVADMVGREQVLDLTNYFRGGEDVVYEAISNDVTTATVSITGSDLTVTFVAAGNTTIDITATQAGESDAVISLPVYVFTAHPTTGIAAEYWLTEERTPYVYDKSGNDNTGVILDGDDRPTWTDGGLHSNGAQTAMAPIATPFVPNNATVAMLYEFDGMSNSGSAIVGLGTSFSNPQLSAGRKQGDAWAKWWSNRELETEAPIALDTPVRVIARSNDLTETAEDLELTVYLNGTQEGTLGAQREQTNEFDRIGIIGFPHTNVVQPGASGTLKAAIINDDNTTAIGDIDAALQSRAITNAPPAPTTPLVLLHEYPIAPERYLPIGGHEVTFDVVETADPIATVTAEIGGVAADGVTNIAGYTYRATWSEDLYGTGPLEITATDDEGVDFAAGYTLHFLDAADVTPALVAIDDIQVDEVTVNELHAGESPEVFFTVTDGTAPHIRRTARIGTRSADAIEHVAGDQYKASFSLVGYNPDAQLVVKAIDNLGVEGSASQALPVEHVPLLSKGIVTSLFPDEADGATTIVGYLEDDTPSGHDMVLLNGLEVQGHKVIKEELGQFGLIDLEGTIDFSGGVTLETINFPPPSNIASEDAQAALNGTDGSGGQRFITLGRRSASANNGQSKVRSTTFEDHEWSHIFDQTEDRLILTIEADELVRIYHEGVLLYTSPTPTPLSEFDLMSHLSAIRALGQRLYSVNERLIGGRLCECVY